MRQTACARRFLPAMIGGGTWEGAHARHEAAGVRQPARRRAAAWPLAASAQQPAKLPTIGFLGASTPSSDSHRVAAFVQRLRELGWIEGRTVAIEYRWAEGRTERYARDRRRVRAAQGRCHRHNGWRSSGSQAGDIGDTDRVPGGRGPGWRRARCDPRATGRQCYRPVAAADRYCRQTGRASARSCARSPPYGDLVQCRQRHAMLELGEVQAAAGTLGLAVTTSEIRRAEDIVSAFEGLKGRADAIYVVADPL